ncbi:sugar ABC transporter substrate-binding protein [Pseudonocardia nematodicida]|uniref:Sugar ABC transporter substrate-binding protein n=1 Tax=Pseudonocardia nematodicida TaxID=1206997 RepID=A0ABV1KJS2_9PSEU
MSRTTPKAVALLAAAALSLTACGTVGDGGGAAGPQEQRAADEVTIGFAHRQMDAPFYTAMEATAQEHAQRDGFSLLFQNAAGSPVTQLDQVQTMLAQGADIIVVDAISPETQRSQFEQVAGQVPLVFVDTGIPDVGITTIESDNEEIGRLSGQLTAARFGSGESISVAILNGGPNDEIAGPARQRGFLQGLTEGGVEHDIVAEASATYTQEEAVPATESMLAAHPDVDLILGLNDSMTLGALQVLRNQGNTDTLVAAAADGQKEALAEIQQGGCDGQYISSGLNWPDLAAAQAFDLALSIATGEQDPAEVEPLINTRAAGIGCENVDEFYDPDNLF